MSPPIRHSIVSAALAAAIPAVLAGTMLSPWGLAAASAAQPTGSSPGSPSGSSCGDSVTVRPGDTLSRIAARCDVTEAALLSANPRIEGSGDLRVGESIGVQPHESAGQHIGRRASSLADKANRALGELASQIGSSAQDLLNSNPDLKARVDQVGRTLGVTGQEATVSLSNGSGAAGSLVTITASGLADGATMVIGAGPPGAAYEPVAQVETTGTGRLERSVRVPGDLQPGPVVFVIATPDGVVRGRSDVFQLHR